jgi:hypothetical protein
MLKNNFKRPLKASRIGVATNKAAKPLSQKEGSMIRLKLKKEKVQKVTVQARIPKEVYSAAAKRLKAEGVTWQTLLEATAKAYGEGAVFYSK